jgi:hypothetical protein
MPTVRVSVLMVWLLLAGMGSTAQEAVGRDALLKRSYEVTEASYQELRRRALAAQPGTTAVPDIGEEHTAESVRRAFACLGVTWPEGSSVAIAREGQRSRWVVVNTTENLLFTERISGEVSRGPRVVSIQARVVEYDEDRNQTVLFSAGIHTCDGRRSDLLQGGKRFFPNGQEVPDGARQEGESIADGVSLKITPQIRGKEIRLVGRVAVTDIVDSLDIDDHNEAPSASYTLRQTVLPFAVAVPSEGGYVSVPMAKRDGRRPELELTVNPQKPASIEAGTEPAK